MQLKQKFNFSELGWAHTFLPILGLTRSSQQLQACSHFKTGQNGLSVQMILENLLYRHIVLFSSFFLCSMLNITTGNLTGFTVRICFKHVITWDEITWGAALLCQAWVWVIVCDASLFSNLVVCVFKISERESVKILNMCVMMQPDFKIS